MWELGGGQANGLMARLGQACRYCRPRENHSPKRSQSHTRGPSVRPSASLQRPRTHPSRADQVTPCPQGVTWGHSQPVAGCSELQPALNQAPNPMEGLLARGRASRCSPSHSQPPQPGAFPPAVLSPGTWPLSSPGPTTPKTLPWGLPDPQAQEASPWAAPLPHTLTLSSCLLWGPCPRVRRDS